MASPENRSKDTITRGRSALLEGRVVLAGIYGPTAIYADRVDPLTGVGRTLVSIAQGVIVEGQRFFVSPVVTDEDGNKIAEIEEIQAAVRAARLIKFALGR